MSTAMPNFESTLPYKFLSVLMSNLGQGLSAFNGSSVLAKQQGV